MELTLVVPGLTGAVRPDGPAPRLPALETLLARADREPCPLVSAEGLVCGLFGVSAASESDLPIAPLRRLGDGGEPDDAAWLCADPVHLIPDRDRLYLGAAESLAVTGREAALLTAELNRLFGPDGFRFEAPAPNRWYLRLPGDAPSTTPLRRAVGHPIGSLLPGGEGGIAWHALLNEVQMLFHASAVNRAREEEGLPAINSLWLWGGGRLPGPPRAGWGRVWADDALSRGLARHAGVAVSARPRSAGDLPKDAGPLLVVDDRLVRAAEATGPAERAAVVDELERDWCGPLSSALRERRLHRFSLYPGGGTAFVNTPRTLRRWWRRRAVI